MRARRITRGRKRKCGYEDCSKDLPNVDFSNPIKSAKGKGEICVDHFMEEFYDKVS